jgi:hypothetical protein
MLDRPSRNGAEPIRTPELAVQQPRTDASVRVMSAQENSDWNSWFAAGFTAYFEHPVNDPSGPVFSLVQRFVDAGLDSVDKEFEEAGTLIGELRADVRELRAEVAELQRRLETAAGPLPVARAWQDGDAALKGELWTHGGSLWQCVADRTGLPPGGPHWACVAHGCETLASSHLSAPDRTDEAKALRADFAAGVEDLRAETGEKILALSGRVANVIANRPTIDKSQIDRAIQAAVARTRLEMRAEFDRALEEKELVFEARVAEFERRAEIAEQRARGLEAAIAELRQQIRDDAIRLADDLRGRARDASLAATTELRSKLESTFATGRMEAEKRAERAEERTRALEIAMVELRGAVRDDVVKASGDLRQQARDASALVGVELREMIEARFIALSERPGRLPIARAYKPDTITRAGHLVAFNGEMFQAIRDTARRPGGGQDWICVARGGKGGRDGRSIIFRGAFDLHEAYCEGDLVSREGQTFIATRDNPTGLPGDSDGWQLLAARGVKGDRGETGPRGHRGDPGPTGATLNSWQLDKLRYRVSPLMADGTVGPMLELRGLFEQYQFETSS